MKKVLGIVVLGLFLSNNAFANIKYIKCTSFELIAFKRSGEIKKDLTNDLEYLFEIDNKTITFIEWPQLISDTKTIKFIKLSFSYSSDFANRNIEIKL